MRIFTCVMLLLAAIPALADSGREARNRSIINQISHEMSVCAAFYGFIQRCATDDAQVRNSTTRNMDNMLILSMEFGLLSGVSADAVASRLRMAMSEMDRATNQSCVNISVLLERHATLCRRLATDPMSVVSERGAR